MGNNCFVLKQEFSKDVMSNIKKEHEWNHFKDTIIILEFIKDYSMPNFN